MVYVGNSKIPGFGRGLFAAKNLPKDEVFAEFEGPLKFHMPGSLMYSETRKDIISFDDGYYIECQPSDMAFMANDVIDFPKNRRKLYKALRSGKPFYKKHPTAKINSSVSINHPEHCAFLIAKEDIKKGTEIFFHYGFPFWFRNEFAGFGFYPEKELIECGIPAKMFEYPGFKAYTKEFFPEAIRTEIKREGSNHIVVLHWDNEDEDAVKMPMDNYSKCELKNVSLEKFKRLAEPI